jgi:hypothetical protein
MVPNTQRTYINYHWSVKIISQNALVFYPSTQILAVSCLRLLVAGLSPWGSSFSPRPVYLKFVVEKVTWRWVFSNCVCFAHQLHSVVVSYSFICHWWYIILAIDIIQ